MTARLIFLTGTKAGVAYDLGDEPVTLGRSTDKSISFGQEEILVSSNHASIAFRDGSYVLRDEGSRNGTYVNGLRVAEHALEDHDLIQFGAGGPGARFTLQTDSVGPPTLDQDEVARAVEKLKQTRPRSELMHKGRSVLDPFTSTRELVVMAVRGSKRTRRWLMAVAGVTVLGLGTIMVLQQVSRSNLQRNLAQLSLALTAERASRTALETTLGEIQTQADSLRAALAGEQVRLAGNPRLDAQAIRRLTQSVALIVFTYGYREQDGNRLVRFVVDDDGNTISTTATDGTLMPGITLGGPGPPIQRQGTATGFLIDTTGVLVTNRHVARPWEEDQQLQQLVERGVRLTGEFLEVRAYFPPGDVSRPVVVDRVSDSADIALLRIPTGGLGLPAIPLAPESSAAQPGDEFVLIGYPTGIHNLLFRVDRDQRDEIWQIVSGEDAQEVAAELARRRLIQPLLTTGSISDATKTEVIHTAATTVGGSGGPLVDALQRVIAVHYASLRSPTPGDPFQTQRGVPVRFIWSMLRGR